MTRFFDYQRVAETAGISPEDLQTIEAGIRVEFPHDDLLFELHVLRACRVVAEGRASLQEVIDTLPGRNQAA